MARQRSICTPAVRSGSWMFSTLSLLITVLLTSLSVSVRAQVSIPSTTAVTENFDGTGSALPSGWKITNGISLTTTSATAIGSPTLNFSGGPTGVLNGMAIGGPAASNIPAGATVLGTGATTVTMSANSVSGTASGATVAFSNGNAPTWTSTANLTSSNFTTSTGSATGGSYAYTSSTANDRAFGFQNSTSFLTPQSIMVNYRNTNTATLTALSVSFTFERYRVNTSAASVDFYYSTDGSTWNTVAAGAIASGVFATGAAAFSFTSGTQTSASRTASITGLNIAPNGNIYLRWNVNLANANSQGLALDNVSTTATFLACSTPAAQPTALSFPTTGTGQISGSFTAAAGAPSGYLVVRYPSGSATTAPTNGTAYTAGNALGLGTVVASGPGTSFVASGLAISTAYDFYVYSYNSVCVGQPFYNTTSPLSGTKSTNGCPVFASTIVIDPAGTRVDGSLYNSLTDALLDLSGCIILQPTVIQLASNYTAAGEVFPLVLPSIAGASATNTITIRPAVGATNLSISGASALPATLGSVVYLNGGQYWIIDGRPGGTGSTSQLTIENTDATIGSAAVRFINGAQFNTLTYCTLRSVNPGVASGTVSFATSTTVGNSNNTISFCDIREGGAGTSNVGLSSVGSAGFANDNNTIQSNNIYNFWTPTQNSYGIYISDNTTNWTISGNSIYQTVSRTQTAGADRNWAGIYISPTTASTVTGLNITGNYIGGTAPLCGGTPLTLSDNGTGNIVFRGIFGQVGTASPTSIQGNTIQNIAVTSSSTSSNHAAIAPVTGSFNIGTVTGNTIGNPAGAGISISLTQTTTSTAGRLSGIIAGVGTPGTIAIANNQIGGLAVNNSSSGTVSLAGIYATGAATSYSISNNTIGNTGGGNSLRNNTSDDTWGIYLGTTTVSNSVSGNSISKMLSGTGRVLGIRTDGGVNTISGNTISGNSTGSTQNTACIGIWQAATASGQTITQNTIYDLAATDAAAATAVHGIYYGGPTAGTNLIERNFVHSLRLATSSVSGSIYGIRVLVGVFPVSLQNNMVRLGIDASGADLSTGYAIVGINNASTGAISHYFNTVYIGGTSVAGTTSNTVALNSTATTTSRIFQNNLLVNARSGGSTGTHYALQLGGTGVNPTGLTNNYNLYYASGSNGVSVLYNGSNYDDLASIRTAIGQDANSLSCDPKLVNPDGNASTLNLHILTGTPTLVEGNGLLIAGVTTDFDGQTRSGLTPTDIGADAGAFTPQTNGCAAVWVGSTSTDWSVAGNWNPSDVPTTASPVLIPGGTVRQPTISSGTKLCASLTLAGNAVLTISSGAILGVNGTVASANSASVAGPGKLQLKGSALQSVTGVLNVANLEIANTSGSGVSIGSGASVNIVPAATSGTGILTFLANAKLTNSGNLTLRSNVNGAASLGVMPASAVLTGNMNIERKAPATAGWYFIGAPVKSPATLSQWSEMGLRVSPKNNSNIFEYTEADTTRGTYNGYLTEYRGWKVPGATSNTINPSDNPKGYRLYLSNSFMTAGGTLSVTGVPFIGNVSAPFTFSTTGFGGGGWNLLANPYPCAIDWNVAKNDVSNASVPSGNAFQIWNGASANYGSYTSINASTGVGVGIASANIASGQAFFIKASAGGTFTFKESFKNPAANFSFLRTAQLDNMLKFKVSQGSNWDEAAILFHDEASDAIDAFDAPNMAGSAVDVATVSASDAFAINVLGSLQGSRQIPLHLQLPATGSASFSFTGIESFASGYSLYLLDAYTGTRTDLRLTPEVSVDVTADPAGAPYRRFSVLVVDNVTVLAPKASELRVWPSPAAQGQELMVSLGGFDGSAITATLTDALGRVVRTMQLSNGTATVRMATQGLPAGTYVLRARNARTSAVRTVILQ